MGGRRITVIDHLHLACGSAFMLDADSAALSWVIRCHVYLLPCASVKTFNSCPNVIVEERFVTSTLFDVIGTWYPTPPHLPVSCRPEIQAYFDSGPTTGTAIIDWIHAVRTSSTVTRGFE